MIFWQIIYHYFSMFPPNFSMFCYILEFITRYFIYFYINGLYFMTMHCIIFPHYFYQLKSVLIFPSLPHLFTQEQGNLHLLYHWSIFIRTIIKFISHYSLLCDIYYISWNYFWCFTPFSKSFCCSFSLPYSFLVSLLQVYWGHVFNIKLFPKIFLW